MVRFSPLVLYIGIDYHVSRQKEDDLLVLFLLLTFYSLLCLAQCDKDHRPAFCFLMQVTLYRVDDVFFIIDDENGWRRVPPHSRLFRTRLTSTHAMPPIRPKYPANTIGCPGSRDTLSTLIAFCPTN